MIAESKLPNKTPIINTDAARKPLTHDKKGPASSDLSDLR